VFYQTVFDHLQNCGCPKCRNSKGENEIIKILDKHQINYEIQKYVYYKNKKFFFDFYVPKKRYFIEFDGVFHFKNTKFSNLKETKRRDFLKNKYCFENNYKLIRISYFDYKNIENILKKYDIL